MSISRGEKIALVCAFGAVVLTAILHIGIREWYQPDLRYEQGGYYKSQNIAITSLRITNFGHSDAEGIIVAANFGYPILDVSIDSSVVSFSIKSGKITEPAITLTIDRLVPQQSISIFYAIEHKGRPTESLPTDFLKSLTFHGGTGKTGIPFLSAQNLLLLAVFLAYFPLTGGMFIYMRIYMRRQREPHYQKISEVIESTIDAHVSGRSREMTQVQVEAGIAKETFRQRTLREVALRLYDALDKRK